MHHHARNKVSNNNKPTKMTIENAAMENKARAQHELEQRLPKHSETIPATREEETLLGQLKAIMSEIQQREYRLYGQTPPGGAGAKANQAFTMMAEAIAREHHVPTAQVIQQINKGQNINLEELVEKLARDAEKRSKDGDIATRGVALWVAKAAEKMAEANALAAHEFDAKSTPNLAEVRAAFIEHHKFPGLLPGGRPRTTGAGAESKEGAAATTDATKEAAQPVEPTPLSILNKQFLAVLKESALKLIFETALRRPFQEPIVPTGSPGDAALGAFVRYVLAVAQEHHMEPLEVCKQMGLMLGDRHTDMELAELLNQEAALWMSIEQRTLGYIEKGGMAALHQGAAHKMSQAAQAEGVSQTEE